VVEVVEFLVTVQENTIVLNVVEVKSILVQHVVEVEDKTININKSFRLSYKVSILAE
jgi:hypothetical protein